MIINLVLIALVFGASKKKLNPYAAAALFGLIKAGIVFWVSESLINAIIILVLFGGAALAMAYFLARVDRRELAEEPYPKFGRNKSAPFKWEYVPLAAAVGFLIFGDMILSLAFG